MADEVDGAVVDDVPMTPEAAEAVEAMIARSGMDLAVRDDSDHELMLRMDEHDVAMLLERVQSSALRKWVYQLPYGKGEGLSVHGVLDVVQVMNWTGRCKVGLLPETLQVETVLADAGNGEEPFWVATVFAEDAVSGAKLPGSSMEPQRMRLKADTADKNRKRGMKIPEDNAIFDTFSRTKAIQKATRNALKAFIPQEIEQTIIAMFLRDPSRVQRIQTEQEAKLAELPPPLDDDRARALNEQARAVYDEIRGLGDGRGKVDLPPGTFGAWSLQAQHDHDLLEQFVAYLQKRRDELSAQYAGGGS